MDMWMKNTWFYHLIEVCNCETSTYLYTQIHIPQVGFCNFFYIFMGERMRLREISWFFTSKANIYFFPLRNRHVTLIFDVVITILLFFLFFFRTDITLMVVWNFQKDYLIIQLCYVTDWVGWKGKNSTNKYVIMFKVNIFCKYFPSLLIGTSFDMLHSNTFFKRILILAKFLNCRYTFSNFFQPFLYHQQH